MACGGGAVEGAVVGAEQVVVRASRVGGEVDDAHRGSAVSLPLQSCGDVLTVGVEEVDSKMWLRLLVGMGETRFLWTVEIAYR